MELNLTPENDGWMTMDVGLRNVTLEVGSTQVKGGMVSATSAFLSWRQWAMQGKRSAMPERWRVDAFEG